MSGIGEMLRALNALTDAEAHAVARHARRPVGTILHTRHAAKLIKLGLASRASSVLRGMGGTPVTLTDLGRGVGIEAARATRLS